MNIDPVILQGCMQQDRHAQRQLYELLLPYLRAVAQRYLRNDSYAMDALQEAFLKIFKNLSQYDPRKGSFRAWATTIVIRTCLNVNQRMIGKVAGPPAECAPPLPLRR